MWLNKYWHVLFFLLAGIFIFSTYTQTYPLSGLIKISPIIVLAIVSFQKISSGFPKLFIIGLLFSMIGDFILDYDRQGAFIYGLAAFFIAHIFYISSLGRWEFAGKQLWIAGLILILSAIAITLIFPNLEDLLIPVLAYMVILLLMGLSTIFSQKSNSWLIIGGLSFLISDSIIGLDKFYTPIIFSHLLIMVTYYFAQYALVRGLYISLQTENSKQ